MKCKYNRIAIAGVFILVSGCVMWDAGYTENQPVTRYELNSADKVPVTYSVNIIAERPDIIAMPDAKGLREKIENALRETGLFSKIQYGAKGGKDSYHIEFTFHQAGMTVEQSMGLAIISGYTLLFVPVCEVITFDGSAVLSLQGKSIFSVAKAEELRCLIWWPMAPFGIFMNAWSVWHFVEKGTVNALCEEITQEHKRRFLQDVNIREIVHD